MSMEVGKAICFLFQISFNSLFIDDTLEYKEKCIFHIFLYVLLK